MSCEHGNLISLDEALAHYYQIQSLSSCDLSLLQAHQHILADDVVSPVALPLFTQSAVDGYALRQSDIAAGQTEFELIGEIRAGIEEHFELEAGQALRIFTGGRLPESADTVARQEIVSRNQNKIVLTQKIAVGADIRYQGEELKQGTLLAQRGQYLNSNLIAALSMAGVQHVTVHRQPKIAVLITGDEVSTQLDNDAKVFDANSPMILTWLKEQGLQQVDLQHVVDDRQQLEFALSHALNYYDLVITTGGVSVGDYDLIRPVSMALGAEEIFWQVAQKPGKPLYFARYQANQQLTQQRSYLIGLPGNPAAVLIGLTIHVATILRALQGASQIQPIWQKATVDLSQIKTDSREQLLRMKLSCSAHGQLQLIPLKKQQSHMLSNLNQANAIARIKAGPAHAQHSNLVEFIAL
ncbi:molybdopterin molybdotransferase MoeA [Acinetobacter populi]|uniref:Molybdopterin molybdenumtransferase n=1 Tax=Acinetobacter populi TaxID=1582270 RepID=A0A1Z9YXW8_9GAMM|nr:molybdopterin molybdotransferase MoeA [Acinetobacter populi]OUY07061.1 molybdopterin molybdenumtransferase MoeA [Acinetobacter populi]